MPRFRYLRQSQVNEANSWRMAAGPHSPKILKGVAAPALAAQFPAATFYDHTHPPALAGNLRETEMSMSEDIMTTTAAPAPEAAASETVAEPSATSEAAAEEAAAPEAGAMETAAPASEKMEEPAPEASAMETPAPDAGMSEAAAPESAAMETKPASEAEAAEEAAPETTETEASQG
ncbi:MAG: hypothetical protein L0Y57_02520 [Beijerinckiaceae bacterium]|nr:hypothetical protein [Beijerinckiaceae bacterium]